MNVDVVFVGILLGEYLAVVIVEPGMYGVLIEDRVLHLQLQLVTKEGIAAAGVDHHFAVDVHFLGAHVEADDRTLGLEVHILDSHTFVDVST